MPITCSNCGAQQPDGAAFCDECGASLNQPQVSTPSPSVGQPAPTVVASDTCPVCGSPTTPGEPFCTNCGASLGGAAPAPPPAPGAPAPTVMAQPPQQEAQPAPGGPQPSPGGLTCSNCGAALEPDSAFCDMCGAPVSAPSPPPQPPKTPPQQYPPSSPPYTPTPAAAEEPAPPQPQAPYAPPPPPSQGRLVIHGTNASLPFPPGKDEIIIGREDPVSGVFPDVDLTDHGGDEGGVSRQHARIFTKEGEYYIEDLDSTNYTFLNQEKLDPRQPRRVKDGAELRFGRVKAVFHTSM